MKYKVLITKNNGYRCTCCTSTFKFEHDCSSLEEALDYCPEDISSSKILDFNSDYETESVEIINQESGETEAFASLSYPSPYKTFMYDYSRWSGYRSDIGRFESIYDASRNKIDDSWQDIQYRVEHRRLKIELSKVENKMKGLQKDVRFYKKQIKEISKALDS